jgi:hypothetical protein
MPTAAALNALSRREDRLIIAALSRQSSSDLITSLASEPHFDWNYFLAQSDQQHITPSLLHPLKTHLKEALPDFVRDTLADRMRTAAVRSMAYMRETIRLQQALDEADIPALFYKGVILSTMLYQQLWERELVDIDILVPADKLRLAKEVILDLDYNAYASDEHRAYQHEDPDRSFQGYDLQQNDGFIAVDLQERFGIRHSSFALDFDSLWKRHRPMQIGGQALCTLSLEDYALVLSAHGAQHRWMVLKWVGDIARLADHSDLDWGYVLEQARNDKITRMVGVGLALASHCYDCAIPPAWREELANDAAASSIAQATLEWMFRPVETLDDLRGRADFDFRFDWAMRSSLWNKAQITWFLLRRRIFRVSDDEQPIMLMKPFRVLVRPITLWQRYGREKQEKVE